MGRRLGESKYAYVTNPEAITKSRKCKGIINKLIQNMEQNPKNTQLVLNKEIKIEQRIDKNWKWVSK